MNKNRYRRVFSKRLGMLVAVAENVKSQGKQPGESGSVGVGAPFGVVSTMTAIAVVTFLIDGASAHAQALPTHGTVVGGQATISQPNGTTMRIDQRTQRAVIDWNTFNIGKGNTVQFAQPNAQAQALNRVTGGLPSNIQGSLLANGQVLIQNANGVLFGRGAVVNVGSLLATTKSIDANAFMAGNPLALSATGKHAGVINEGDITAQGYVVLMGDQVRNAGNIKTAPGGQVMLAAGDAATVALPNGQGISLVLTDATAGALVENSGNSHAQAGAVLLTARGKNTLLNTVVNLSGVVRAGTVVADAGKTGDVTLTGAIDASNTAAGGKGGTVVLSGDRVGMFGGASIKVKGDAAGGKVVLGGDSLGKLAGTEAAKLLQDGVAFASLTQVDGGASIDAGALNGNGGFVETSGRSLDVKGRVSASAPNGKGGEWLIDPTDVYIDDDSGPNGHNGNVTGGFDTGTNNTATVRNTAINDALNNGTDVTISTASAGNGTGNIRQYAGADITKTSGGAANLTLAANGSISIEGNITSTSDRLNLNLTAAMGGNDGGVATAGNSRFDLNGGRLDVSGNTTGSATRRAVDLGGTWSNIGGGSIRGDATGADAVVVRNLTLTQGAFNVTGSTVDGRGVYTANVSLSGNAALNLAGTSVNGAGVQVDRNTLISGNAEMNVIGNSVNSPGTFISSGADSLFSVSGSAQVQIVGSSSRSIAVWLMGNVSLSGESTVNLVGNSETSHGVWLQGLGSSVAVSENSTLNVSGTTHADSPGAGNPGAVGVGIRYGLNVTGDGRLNIVGNATAKGRGIYEADTGSVEVAGNGAINMTGTSVDGDGLYFRGSVNVGDRSALNMSGSSSNGTGVRQTDEASSTWNIGGNGSLNVIGTSVNGNGTDINGVNTVSGNGSLSVTGNSSNGNGHAQGGNGSLNIGGNGSVNISGNSTNGSGVSLTGRTGVDGNGSLNVSGNSTNGTGVNNGNGTINTGGNGSTNVSGNSTEGTGVDNGNGTINTTGNGSTNVSGNSTNGTGINNGNGTINTGGNGSTNISGNSSNGTGINNGNGTINTGGNGSTNISGNSTNGTGIDNTNGTINTTGNGSTNVSGNSTNGTDIDNTNGTIKAGNITGNVADNSSSGGNGSNGSGSGGSAGAGGSGGGSSGSGAAIAGAAGAVGLGAGLAYFWTDLFGADWHLASPQALTVEMGDKTWVGATLEAVDIDASANVAKVKMATQSGQVERSLEFRDGADGVKHYVSEDPQTKMKADLSVNTQTREFFYTESGVKNGQPYVVKTHGWLKASTEAPAAPSPAAGTGLGS